MDELDRLLESNLELESDLETARKAVTEHLYGGRGDEPWTGGDTPVNQAWLDRYDQLKAAADQALSAADQAWSIWVARMRHQ